MIQGAAFRVLACFYTTDTASFAAICEQAGYPTDLGGYYLRQLVAGDYVIKIDRGQYAITPKGKQQLAFHYGKHFLAPRPRVTIVLVARQAKSYVVLQRKVQPFIGTAEWPAGAVEMGEPLEDAAHRLARARFGVEPEGLTLQGFFRRVDRYEDAIFDDKVFAVHTCALPEGSAMAPAPATGELVLYSEAELQQLEKPSRSLMDILAFAQRPEAPFTERVYALTLDDLQS